MRFKCVSNAARTFLCACAIVFVLASFSLAQQYQQTNLDSDIAGLALNPQGPDVLLCNPWGIATGPGSPVWVANNNSGTSTLYDVAGNLKSLMVKIPPTTIFKTKCSDSSASSTPTGIAFTGGSGFVIPKTNPAQAALFTFVTEGGTISAWNPANGNTATQILDNSNVGPGAVYKGATVAANGTQMLLYVTNFRAGTIETYDTNFNQVHLDADGDNDGDGAFRDRAIPRGFAPFNVQAVSGNLYVTYAKQNSDKHDDFDAPGLGFVDKFSPSGKLLQRLEPGPWLDAPWGVALAPPVSATPNFGFYSGHLLIGNAGSGQIAVYDPNSGRFDGLLRDQSGHALQNQRLWALYFSDGVSRNGAPPTQGPPNTLFFTAGVNDEADGLFGIITPADNAKAEQDRDDH
jgi:uncharacterized protein (TIGR03118 family)